MTINTNTISTSIDYNKSVTIVQSKVGVNTDTGKVVDLGSRVFSCKKSELMSFVSTLEAFSIKLKSTVLNKLVKSIKAEGFDIDVDMEYGFDWECKIYCSK